MKHSQRYSTVKWLRHGEPLPDGYRLVKGQTPSNHHEWSVLIERIDARDRHWNWNAQGRAIDKLGFVRVRVGKDHPLAQHPSGWAYEHLLVWRASGRPRPRANEVIHHRNGDKTDNRLANLQKMSRAAHLRHHAQRRALRAAE